MNRAKTKVTKNRKDESIRVSQCYQYTVALMIPERYNLSCLPMNHRDVGVRKMGESCEHARDLKRGTARCVIRRTKVYVESLSHGLRHVYVRAVLESLYYVISWLRVGVIFLRFFGTHSRCYVGTIAWKNSISRKRLLSVYDNAWFNI